MEHQTEAEIAEMFARHRWGPTGFRCDRCRHDQGWHLKCRARVWECKACHHQQSVVAGTLMAHSKVPLRVWLVRGRFHQRGQVPTCAQLSQAAGVALSTAWLLNQKIFLALAGVADRTFQLTATCLRPRKELGPLAPEPMRAAWRALRDGRARTATVHVAERIRVTGVCEHPEDPLGRRISRRLRQVHRAVCIRWLERWVGHLVDLVTPSDWLLRALAHPPAPLRQLAPHQ